MTKEVDLAYQVQGLLGLANGGAGNSFGLPPGVARIETNGSGSTIAVNDVVRYIGTANIREENTVGATSTDSDTAVLGICAGLITTAGVVSYQSVPDQGRMLVVRYGQVPVNVSANVTAGEFAYTSTTTGQVYGQAAFLTGAIGIFKTDGTAGGTAIVRLFPVVAFSGHEVFRSPSPTILTQALEQIALADELRGHNDGGNVGIEINPVPVFLQAQQSAVTDAGGYYTVPTPSSGAETLRPDSDVESHGPVTTNPAAHPTYWDLLDSTSPGSDFIAIGSGGQGTADYVITGIAASAIDNTHRITSVEFHAYVAIGAIAGSASLLVRDPQTGKRWVVATIPNNHTGDATVTLTTRPWDSLGWTLSDIAHLQMGVSGCVTIGGPTVYQEYAVVNWTRPVTVESALAEIAGTGLGRFETTRYGGQDVVNTVAASGASQTLDLADGNVQDVTLTADCAITTTGYVVGVSSAMSLILREDGTGGWNPTFTDTIAWLGGEVPIFDTAADAVNVIVLWSFDGGTTIGGTLAGSGSLRVSNQGTLLPAAAASLDFTGSVRASGTTSAKTVDIFTDHEHIGNVTFSGDASTTAFELPAAPYDAYAVAAYVAGTRTAVTLSGAMLTTMTFGSAPASGTDNIIVDIVAVVA